jgi:hypothetical protein
VPVFVKDLYHDIIGLMPEVIPEVRGLIVEFEPYKLGLVSELFIAAGGLVAAKASRPDDVLELVNEGAITPANLDVAFLDSRRYDDLGHEVKGAGLEIARLFQERGLAREVCGSQFIPDGYVSEQDANRIVVVGTSLDRAEARKLGSYSDKLGGPMFIDWKPKAMDLAAIVAEVRRLKPA